MDIFRVKCSKFDASTLIGYRRGAYAVSTLYGLSFKNLNYEGRFGVVMHQNMDDKDDVLVEIFQLKNGGWMDRSSSTVPIPYETLKRLTVGTDFHDKVVERNGHAFVCGMKYNGCYSRPSSEMFFSTNAYDLLKNFGTALSVALTYPDSVHDLGEGVEFNEKVHDIINFDSEMRGSGVYTCGIENARKRIYDIQKEMEEEDEETSDGHRRFAEAVETLEQYGITYKKRKVA